MKERIKKMKEKHCVSQSPFNQVPTKGEAKIIKKAKGLLGQQELRQKNN